MSKLGMAANTPGTQEAAEFKASLGYTTLSQRKRRREKQRGKMAQWLMVPAVDDWET